MVGHDLFEGQEAPEEVVCAAFATGYPCPTGYESGIMLGLHRFSAGRFVLNTLRVLENLGCHSAADRLLLNLVTYARSRARAHWAPLSASAARRLAGLYGR